MVYKFVLFKKVRVRRIGAIIKPIYSSIIKIDNDDVKIITDAINNPAEFNITSVDSKVSDIEKYNSCVIMQIQKYLLLLWLV